MNPVLAIHEATKGAERQRRFYEPELDVLRFCAFLAVFCFHVLPSGYSDLVPRFGPLIPGVLLAARNAMAFGVCMFFLLSAYLITKLLVLEREKTGAIHLKSFYIRRILRIWPLYLTFLIAMWILGRIHIFYPIETSRFIAFLLFSGNVYTSWFGFTYNPILPRWTISIEEQFYIVWPLLACAGDRFLKVSAVTVICISVLSTVLLGRSSKDAAVAVWTSSLVQFQFFAIGSLLALRFSRCTPAFSWAIRLSLAMAGLALMMIAGGPLHIGQGPTDSPALLTFGYELMALGTVLVFLAFLGAARKGMRVPSGLTYLGQISYGL
jgi:peptidoglycan/LPS O-acetylase OafA/YrhL